MQKWYRKPPPWLLRAHDEHCQGHLHTPHRVGVRVHDISMWHMFLPQFFMRNAKMISKTPSLISKSPWWTLSRTSPCSSSSRSLSTWYFDVIHVQWSFDSHKWIPHEISWLKHVPCHCSSTLSPSCWGPCRCPSRCSSWPIISFESTFGSQRKYPYEILGLKHVPCHSSSTQSPFCWGPWRCPSWCPSGPSMSIW